ncbi:LLM class F420-dependent oxidoreductase [Sporichthya polymorpha]|uniref:LLM class F420-dependent oxidoreductase n=1 Tax=Sporichthya polymorpha TaxID=35751 RepID=UPI00036FC699|nr:LLM class F420-dependent oxidoreductase [Sporichthya polymorpha]
MRFTVDYPVSAPGYDPAILRPEGMATIARTADELGYGALAFTDHPAPSQKWMDAGGHESLDIFSALGFCAAHTTRIKLMTYLLVLPYRNPFLTAKGLITLDLLSEGRVIAGVGTGYLRSEFRALGADFAARNALFDEALAVIRGVFRQSPFSFAGEHVQAADVAALPRPVQPGGPPLIVGGASRVARERAARLDGWTPLITTPEEAASIRSPQISTVEELGAQIAEVREAAGRDLFLQTHTPQTAYLSGGFSVEEHRDHLGRLAEAGVGHFVVRPTGASVEAVVDELHTYADTFFG